MKLNINLFRNRLQALRKEAGLTQQQLADEIAALISSDNSETLSYITISAYERGSRMPVVTTLIAMATFFNVSLDYLTGLDSIPDIKRTVVTTEERPFEEPDILIDTRELKKYNGNPVFVVAPPEKKFLSRWGILDFEKKRIVFTNCIVPLTPDLKLFQYRPIEAQFLDISFKQPLTISPLVDCDTNVWCEMLNAEPVIKGQYNGWYRHNENKSALINIANGLTLPYSGCGISYNAYKI